MTSLNSSGFPGSHLKNGGQNPNLEQNCLVSGPRPGLKELPRGGETQLDTDTPSLEGSGPGPGRDGSKQASEGVRDALRAGGWAQAKARRPDGPSRVA